MFFPIGDTNVKGGFKPIFCYLFILINIVLFLVQVSTPGHLVCEFASIPNDLVEGRRLFTLITSMFLHGGWMHLIGNMLFLWVFADNIEAVLGNMRFMFFYLIGGVVATMVHVFFEVGSSSNEIINCCRPCLASVSCDDLSAICTAFTPSIGASGAISAVLGAYIVLFPKSKIKVFFLLFSFTVPAIAFLGLWFAEQLISGLGALSAIGAAAGGVAWWAHIGGFIFGLVYGLLVKNTLGIYTLDRDASKQKSYKRT